VSPNIVDGDFVYCQFAQVPGISYDGGYADYMIAPTEAVASIPDELSATEAAPMMCAGIPHTTLFETVVHVKATSLQYSE
jgi:D-arabinose 1-dehydrogenase-like Zn-dependent alcohol dehydrogenase